MWNIISVKNTKTLGSIDIFFHTIVDIKVYENIPNNKVTYYIELNFIQNLHLTNEMKNSGKCILIVFK